MFRSTQHDPNQLIYEFGLVVTNGSIYFFELVVIALAQSRFEVAAQLFVQFARSLPLACGAFAHLLAKLCGLLL